MASFLLILSAPLWVLAVAAVWLAAEVRLLRCGQVMPGFWMLLRESLDTLALRSTQAKQLARLEANKARVAQPNYYK